MDLQTAKELDYVLSEIGHNTNIGFVHLRMELTNKHVRYPMARYIDYLIKLDYIEESETQKNAFRKTITGLTFIGFEKEIEKEKSEGKKLIVYTLLSGSLGAVLGATIGLAATILQPKPILDLSNLPKIQVFHDTIYIANPQSAKDTSLVKIVK